MFIDTPIGRLCLRADENTLTNVYFENQAIPDIPYQTTLLLRKAGEELAEYFGGHRREFTLPLAPKGTPFQLSVWNALRAVPFGQTRTYGQIAASLGNAQAARAVGLANNRNPMPIFIPCHRIIGANGKLVGYAGSLPVKEALLALERRA